MTGGEAPVDPFTASRIRLAAIAGRLHSARSLSLSPANWQIHLEAAAGDLLHESREDYLARQAGRKRSSMRANES